MEARKFEMIQPELIAEIKMPDGSTRRLICQAVTRDMMDRILSQRDNMKGDKMYDQLAIFYGGKKEDYYDITDIRLVKQLIDFVLEQIKNPI